MSTAVHAINKEHINLVHALLDKKFGRIYADIFKIGINMALRISDLLAIKYTDLNLASREMQLVEQKTGKKRIIRLNSVVIKIVEDRRRDYPVDVWLFQVRCSRANNKPISRVSVARVFKDAGEMLGLTISTHSMRKTRGKAMFDAGVPIEKIAKVLNHQSPAATMRYIGIEHEQVMQTYDDFEL